MNELLSRFPNGAPMEKDDPFPEPMVYSFIRISQSPQLRSSPKKQGKTYVHSPRIPTRTEGLHTKECGLVPQRDRLPHCCCYPSAMRLSTRYLPQRR
jgi:hypothetical protein